MEYKVLQLYKDKRKELNKKMKAFSWKEIVLMVIGSCILILSVIIPNIICKGNRVLYLVLFLILYSISCTLFGITFRMIKDRYSSDNGERYKQLLKLLDKSIIEVVGKNNRKTIELLIIKCKCIVEQYERKHSERIKYIIKSCSVIGLVTSFLVANNEAISKGVFFNSIEWENILTYIIAIASAVAILELILIVLNKTSSLWQGYEDLLEKLYDLKMYLYG